MLGLLIDQRPDPGHTVRAIGYGRRETRPGSCTHWPLWVSANTSLTCDVSPVRSPISRSIPTPACDTTPTPSADTLTRHDRLLRFTKKVPYLTGNATLDKSHYPLRDRHFR